MRSALPSTTAMQRTLSRRPASYTVTQAGLWRTDKDDGGAVITAAFIACIHGGIAAVKARIQSGATCTSDALVLLGMS